MPEMRLEKKGGKVRNVKVGKPRIRAKGPKIVALEFDLPRKGLEVWAEGRMGDGSPVVWLDPGLNEVKLSGYKGWKIFNSGVARYTLRICLVK
jgi:hypothetical protein